MTPGADEGGHDLVAFLRGINLGRRRVTNDRLRDVFTAMDGVGSVATFLASGNVIFEARPESESALQARIESHLAEALGYEVATFLRPLDEVRKIGSAEVFGDERAREGDRVHVIFLARPAPEDAGANLDTLATNGDRFTLRRREIYWLRRGRLSDSPITTSDLEKTLSGIPITMRTRDTVRRIGAKFT